jgi:cysteine synthase B
MNPQAHYDTTGPEVYQQTKGAITHFIAGIGTGGTLIGTGRFLKEMNPAIKVIAVEPDDALHGLEGRFPWGEARTYSPSAGEAITAWKPETVIALHGVPPDDPWRCRPIPPFCTPLSQETRRR